MEARYERHQVSSALGQIDEWDFQSLVESMRIYGQLVPIVMDADGAIIDGAQRYRACLELGLEPRIIRLDEGDPAGLSATLNLCRRHMSPAARARAAATLAGMTSDMTVRELCMRLGIGKSTYYRIKKEEEQKKRRKAAARKNVPKTAVERRDAAAEMISTVIHSLKAARNCIQEYLRAGLTIHWNGLLEGMISDINALIDVLSSAAPADICDHCDGEGCRGCKHQGWLPRVFLDPMQDGRPDTPDGQTPAADAQEPAEPEEGGEQDAHHGRT